MKRQAKILALSIIFLVIVAFRSMCSSWEWARPLPLLVRSSDLIAFCRFRSTTNTQEVIQSVIGEPSLLLARFEILDLVWGEETNQEIAVMLPGELSQELTNSVDRMAPRPMLSDFRTNEEYLAFLAHDPRGGEGYVAATFPMLTPRAIFTLRDEDATVVTMKAIISDTYSSMSNGNPSALDAAWLETEAILLPLTDAAKRKEGAKDAFRAYCQRIRTDKERQ